MIKRKKFSYITIGFTLFLLLALVIPVSATVWPVTTANAGTSILFQPWINGTSSNDTIDLAPGTYFLNNLTVFQNLTIESNQTLGGTAQNTIIDGQYIPTNNGIIGNNSVNAVFFEGSTITIKDLTLQNGNSTSSAGGGAVSVHGNIVVYSSNFLNDASMGHYGGALSMQGGNGNITVSGSNFINCSANQGGAIYDNNGNVFVTSSSFVNIQATTLAGAIYGTNGVNATFCRFSNITCPGDHTFIETNGGDIYAPNNWWGTNNPDHLTIFKFNGGGTYTLNPWLVLGITAQQSTITTIQTNTITANLLYYNDSTPQSGNIPTDGMPVTFTVVPAASGSVSTSSGTFANMLSQTTFTPRVVGSVSVNATVDNAIVSVSFDITPAPNNKPSYGQPNTNPNTGYIGPQPAPIGVSSGGPGPKPQLAPLQTVSTPIASVTALPPVQNPSIIAMVILTLQEYQFWLILAVIVIILVAILRRWWIKRQNPSLFRKQN
jgi:uncharacterized membrane protein